jgi:hypothetical protein
MPEANLFLMFTQRLNALGVAYMVSGSVAVIFPSALKRHNVLANASPTHHRRLERSRPIFSSLRR